MRSNKYKLAIYGYNKAHIGSSSEINPLFKKEARYYNFAQDGRKLDIVCGVVMYNNQFSKHLVIHRDENKQMIATLSPHNYNRHAIKNLTAKRAGTINRTKVITGSVMIPRNIVDKLLRQTARSPWKDMHKEEHDVLLTYMFAKYILEKGRYYGKLEKII